MTTTTKPPAFGRIQVKCPVCHGEGIVGYLSGDNSKPPEQGECYRCDGTGSVVSSEPLVTKANGFILWAYSTSRTKMKLHS